MTEDKICCTCKHKQARLFKDFTVKIFCMSKKNRNDMFKLYLSTRPDATIPKEWENAPIETDDVTDKCEFFESIE